MVNIDLKIKKQTGSHYTPNKLAEFVSEQIFSNCAIKNGKKFRILDPAVGDGELLLAISRILNKNSITNFELNGFDTNRQAINFAKDRINKQYPNLKLNLMHSDFLQFVLKNYTNFGLFQNNNLEQYDIIITNPPYVRTQIMGADKSQDLAKIFNLSGRVDLYQAFIKALSFVVKENGIAGIIVSNRFMYIKTGEAIRQDILKNFEIKGIWDFGDTKLFDAAVLPAVLILEKKCNPKNAFVKFTSIYSCDVKLTKVPVPSDSSIFNSLEYKGPIKLNDGSTYIIKNGLLEFGESQKNVWRLSDKESDDWLRNIESNSYTTFGKIGKIRVGVKTTADNVFIRDDWEELGQSKPEDELLRPLINHKVANQFKPKTIKKQTKILYPYISDNGKRVTVDLEKFPQALKYLLKYKEQLENRKYLIESNRNWFEIWVPQQPSNWNLPKLIFWDIAPLPTFWVNTDGAIVNGDCYWFTLDDPDKLDLFLLCLAVGNSKFIEQFYDIKFNNKLYAGRRRFQAQYVNNFPIPKIENSYSKQIIYNTKRILETSDEGTINSLITENNDCIFKSFNVKSFE